MGHEATLNKPYFSCQGKVEHNEAPGFVEEIFALCWVTSFDQVRQLDLPGKRQQSHNRCTSRTMWPAGVHWLNQTCMASMTGH